jgi:hypothetical protein
MAHMFVATESRLAVVRIPCSSLSSAGPDSGKVPRYRIRRGNARIARANALRSPKHAQLGGGRSQLLARRFARAGRNQACWNSGPLEGRVFFVGQEELHSANCAAGLNLRQRFLSLDSPEPKRLTDAVVMQGPRLAAENREAFSLNSLFSLQGGSIQGCHQSFEERLNQRKGVAAQLCKLCLSGEKMRRGRTLSARDEASRHLCLSRRRGRGVQSSADGLRYRYPPQSSLVPGILEQANSFLPLVFNSNRLAAFAGGNPACTWFHCQFPQPLNGVLHFVTGSGVGVLAIVFVFLGVKNFDHIFIDGSRRRAGLIEAIDQQSQVLALRHFAICH